MRMLNERMHQLIVSVMYHDLKRIVTAEYLMKTKKAKMKNINIPRKIERKHLLQQIMMIVLFPRTHSSLLQHYKQRKAAIILCSSVLKPRLVMVQVNQHRK